MTKINKKQTVTEQEEQSNSRWQSFTQNVNSGIIVLWQFSQKMLLLLTIAGIIYATIVIWQGTKDLNMVLPMAPAVAWAMVALVKQFTK